MKKKRMNQDNKGWASFRIRGIQTSLKTLADNKELSNKVRMKLLLAQQRIDEAVDFLDEEREINETMKHVVKNN
jgi:hypothetical protein